MRFIRLLLAAMVGAVISIAVPPAAQADTRTCVGSATIGEPTNLTTRSADGVTVETWEFTGRHDLCLADGTVVVAMLTGQAMQVRRDGEAPCSSCGRRCRSPPGRSTRTSSPGRLPPASRPTWSDGTGELTGVTGHSTTTPTGPGSFRSQIVYRNP